MLKVLMNLFFVWLFFLTVGVSEALIDTVQRSNKLCPNSCQTSSWDGCNSCDCTDPLHPVCTEKACPGIQLLPRYCEYTKIVKEACPDCCTLYNNGCQECVCKVKNGVSYMICNNNICIRQGPQFCVACEYPKVWNECGTNCPPTCENPDPICTLQCVPRCECPSESPYEPKSNHRKGKKCKTCSCLSEEQCKDSDSGDSDSGNH